MRARWCSPSSSSRRCCCAGATTPRSCARRGRCSSSSRSGRRCTRSIRPILLRLGVLPGGPSLLRSDDPDARDRRELVVARGLRHRRPRLATVDPDLRAHRRRALVATALAVYWLRFADPLLAEDRYYMRTVLLVGTAAIGIIAAVVVIWTEGGLGERTLLSRAMATLAGGAWAAALAGAIAIVMLIHAVESARFVDAFTQYRAAVRALATGARPMAHSAIRNSCRRRKSRHSRSAGVAFDHALPVGAGGARPRAAAPRGRPAGQLLLDFVPHGDAQPGNQPCAAGAQPPAGAPARLPAPVRECGASRVLLHEFLPRDPLEVLVIDLLLHVLREVEQFQNPQRLADVPVPFSGSNGQSEANTIFSVG